MKYVLCGEKEDFVMFEKKINVDGAQLIKSEHEGLMSCELNGEKIGVIKNWLVENITTMEKIFGGNQCLYEKERNRFGIKMIQAER